MSDEKGHPFERLRELAEELISQKGVAPSESDNEISRLLHEIHVHQIELRVQNEELQRSYQELKVSKQEFADLFDYAPVSYFVIDEKGLILQINLTALAKFNTTHQAIQSHSFFELVAQQDRDQCFKYHRAILAGKHPPNLEVWFENDKATFFGKVESVVAGSEGGSRRVRVAITDITERKVYQDRLEAIHRLDQAISRQSPLISIIEIVIEELWRTCGCGYTAVILFADSPKDTRFFIRANQPDTAQQPLAIKSYPHASLSPDDIVFSPGENVHVVNKPIFLPQGTVENYPVHLFVPVTHDGRRKGFIDLGVKHANDLQGMPIEVIQQLAVELGIAIQQAAFIDKIQQHTTELETMVEERTSQLFASQQSEHEQRIFAEGMLAIVKNINQSLELEHVLKQVLINLENIVSYDGAQIVISDPDGDTTRVESRGDLQIEHDLQSNTSLVFENYPVYVKMARTREPILVREGASDLLFEGKQPEVALESYLGVPIQSGQQLFGFINLYGAQADAFESEDTKRLQAFAEHISIAVRNARSYLQSQELAAVEERQRLARDLHDAVSQLLFSLSIMAETLPNLARKKQYDRLASVSNDINLLASSAYAEMRLLLLELRPMSFENVRLEDLLQQMATAFVGRHSSLLIQIDVQAGGALSIAVKNNLYRIVQEALNNITKHAEAEQVAIQVWEEGETMHLTVEDNGTGFDIAQMSGGHGLKIMYERAAKIGASLTINSVIGQGTRLHMIYDRNMGNAST